MKVIVDTNFFLLPHQFGIDIFEYLNLYEIATFSQCLIELEKMSKSRGNDGKAARVALNLIESNKVEVLKSKEKSADDAILNYALSEKCAVATNDAGLIKALKKYGIKVIRLKQRAYLIEE